jgi:hypothetical protein
MSAARDDSYHAKAAAREASARLDETAGTIEKEKRGTRAQRSLRLCASTR